MCELTYLIMIDMKIALTGSTCSGKTTFLNYLGFKLSGLRTDIGILNERAMECPYPRNERGGFLTQQWILSNQIMKEYELEKQFPIVITDRTVFDVLAYIQVAPHTNAELNFATTIAKEWDKIHPYDYIVYFSPLTHVMKPERVELQLRVDRILRDTLTFFAKAKIICVPVNEKEKRCEDVYNIVSKLIEGSLYERERKIRSDPKISE